MIIINDLRNRMPAITLNRTSKIISSSGLHGLFLSLLESPSRAVNPPVSASRITLLHVVLATGLASSVAVSAETVAYTPPLGGMSVTIHGGTATAPVTTAVALPISDIPSADGAKRARVTAVSTDTITATTPGWTASALATPAYPYDARLVSGSGLGARLTITGNTTDTLTISGRDPSALGVATGANGDIFELVPVDTLDSLFGNDTFLGGTTATAADTISLAQSDQNSYFYDTNTSQWTDTVSATSDTGATRLPPEGTVTVERKHSAFTLRFVGAPAQTDVNVLIANSGPTFTHTGFPRSITLGQLSLQSKLAGWASNSAVDQADLVGIAAGASWVFYFHNGTNWQRTPGDTTSRDDAIIPAGTPIQIFRRGSAGGSTALVLNHPSN